MSFLLHSLYSPFCYFYFGTLAAWLYIRWRIRNTSTTKERIAMGLFGAGLAFIGGFSSPLGNALLHQTLLTDGHQLLESAPVGYAPDFILVAASGYLLKTDSREDVLNDNTASRVARAARLFAEYPNAIVIMQGTGKHEDPAGYELRSAPHQGELMARLAVAMGVPENRIRLEDRSRNSREHAQYLLTFPEISPESRLLVVSSDWHIRRLHMVFEPVFRETRYDGARLPTTTRISLHSIWPQEDALARSRIFLREWAAIIYYAFGGRNQSGPVSGSPKVHSS